MDTAELVREFQCARRISDSDMLTALLAYVGNQDSNDALMDFLAENFDEA